MQTSIELDDAMVEEAFELSKIKTKKKLIQEALKHYVSFLKKKELLNLGQVSWEGNLKDMRKGRA